MKKILGSMLLGFLLFTGNVYSANSILIDAKQDAALPLLFETSGNYTYEVKNKDTNNYSFKEKISFTGIKGIRPNVMIGKNRHEDRYIKNAEVSGGELDGDVVGRHMEQRTEEGLIYGAGIDFITPEANGFVLFGGISYDHTKLDYEKIEWMDLTVNEATDPDSINRYNYLLGDKVRIDNYIFTLGISKSILLKNNRKFKPYISASYIYTIYKYQTPGYIVVKKDEGTVPISLGFILQMDKDVSLDVSSGYDPREKTITTSIALSLQF
jgi:hypothetical protein